MKKILTILATLTLTSGVIMNATAFTKDKQNIPKQCSKKTPQPKNEDVEDIANKLFGKMININPSFWLNKDIANYQSQFNAAIVKQGILTKTEVQYVTWKSLDILRAGYFWNQADFTVSKDAATATGKATVNASNGETSKEVSAKISKAKLNFNFNYWNGKTILSQFQLFRQMFVNEKILTPAEASLVSLATSGFKITKAGSFTIQLHVNDGNQDVITPLHLAVLDDGLSAQQITGKLNGGIYYLKANTQGKYADSTAVTKNFRDLLTHDLDYSDDNANDITLSHTILKEDNKNMTAKVTKDGQIATTNQIEVIDYNYPYTVTQYQSNNYFQVFINLTPQVVNRLTAYYRSHPATTTQQYSFDLGYFYQVINDGQYVHTDNIPKDPNDPEQFIWWDRLDGQMGDYGGAEDEQVSDEEADCSNDAIKYFSQSLIQNTQVASIAPYLTVMFEWDYGTTHWSELYSINKWAYW